MRHKSILICVLAILPIFLIGCATTQTVHWQEDTPAAAAQVVELSAEHKATIRDRSGARFWGRDVSIAEDAVRWTRTRDGEPQVMLLAEVASIEFVTGRHVGKGLLLGVVIGAGAGALLGAIECVDGDCYDLGTGTTVGIGAYYLGLTGAVLGVLIGAFSADKVIFVPQK